MVVNVENPVNDEGVVIRILVIIVNNLLIEENVVIDCVNILDSMVQTKQDTLSVIVSLEEIIVTKKH